MQGLWYGDRRDRVKWGALVYLARRFDLRSILQVAYLRDKSEKILRTDEGDRKIAVEVWGHFADLKRVESLSKALGVEIKVHDTTFDPTRRPGYIDGVRSAAARLRRPRLLFLDPDTGTEPNALGPGHASNTEITQLWSLIEPAEVLAVYQHASRNPTWIARSVQRTQAACPGADVRSITGAVAQDVAILWARKQPWRRRATHGKHIGMHTTEGREGGTFRKIKGRNVQLRPEQDTGASR